MSVFKTLGVPEPQAASKQGQTQTFVVFKNLSGIPTHHEASSYSIDEGTVRYKLLPNGETIVLGPGVEWQVLVTAPADE